VKKVQIDKNPKHIGRRTAVGSRVGRRHQGDRERVA
jgi:hypothetical protein